MIKSPNFLKSNLSLDRLIMIFLQNKYTLPLFSKDSLFILLMLLLEALMTADAGMRLQRGRKWVTVQQGTDHVGTDWLYI